MLPIGSELPYTFRNTIEETLEEEGPVGPKIAVLDNGYLQCIEYWGCDARIIESARMSTGKGFKTWDPYRECTICGEWILPNEEPMPFPCNEGKEHRWREIPRGDVGLLSYLYSNKHATPFEMAGLVIEVQAPIMVFREWHRHRTQSYNEMSARYIPLPDVNYVPSVERLMAQSLKNKQTGTIADADVLTKANAIWFQDKLRTDYLAVQNLYEWALQTGIPKELARLCIPVGRYSRMRACANLRNWLAFLTLRMDANAQWEIRMFANEIGKLIKALYPRTWDLFIAGKDYPK